MHLACVDIDKGEAEALKHLSIRTRLIRNGARKERQFPEICPLISLISAFHVTVAISRGRELIDGCFNAF